MRLDAFGSVLRVERRAGAWWAAWEGGEGKLAPTDDVAVPATLAGHDVAPFLDDPFRASVPVALTDPSAWRSAPRRRRHPQEA